MVDERTTNIADWATSMNTALCEVCDWRFLLPSGSGTTNCPHCFSDSLVILAETQVDVEPELYLPFDVTEDEFIQSIHEFMKGLWFPPVDLTFGNLRQRLRRVYLPVWLIDSLVNAQWQAESGFDYRVVSHQDHYDDARGGWSSQKVTETRVRWEARLGRISKRYHNVAVPALEKHSLFIDRLGEYAVGSALAYDQQQVLAGSLKNNVLVRLADRSQKDAWPDALPKLRNLAAEDCRQACAADHIRNFTWTPEFQELRWTLLLLPMYTTFFLDDQKKPQSLLIHGQTGRIFGTRRGSMERARNTALWMAGAAFVIFIISLIVALVGALVPALLILATIGWGVSVLLGLGAIAPIAIVWWINRSP